MSTEEVTLRPSLALLFLFATLVIGAAPAYAQSITLNVPETVKAGEEFEVTWEGSAQPKDFVSLDEVGAPDKEYGSYFYPSKRPVGKLLAPSYPGQVAVRYHSGESGFRVLATALVTVTEVTASFQPIAEVSAGAEFEVHWEGPGHPRDYISIDEPGSPEKEYGPYKYARSSPVKLKAPDTTGTWTVRYHMGNSHRVLAETPLVVGGVEASLDGPTQAPAGSVIEVAWEGPDNQGDYISVDPLGAPDKEYGRYTYTKRGSPAKLTLPEEVGTYEVRYHMGGSSIVLASYELTTLANEATVSGPASVVAGSKFEVAWTGPANPSDFLTIVPVGSGNREYMDYDYARKGSPSTIVAPLEPGDYELRYITGGKRQVLANAPIQVTPGEFPGTLQVFSDKSGSTTSYGAVEVILDASGSMLQRLDGERRIEIAKRALRGLVEDVIPKGTQFALRVFGHKEADSCRSDLEITAGPLDPASALSKIGSINAMNLARTPIGASLGSVRQDLNGVPGPYVVVLLTDGEETCDGDPKAAIESLRSAGIDVRVNIVGFAIDDLRLAEEFSEWARIGGGRYIKADDAEQLDAAMGGALETTYEVLQDGSLVTTGVIDGPAVRLLPGTYTVRVRNGEDLGTVTVDPNGKHALTVEN